MSQPSFKKALVRLFDEQSGRCCYCDGATWLPRRETRKQAMERFGLMPGIPGTSKLMRGAVATREHIVRIVDGGSHGANVKMACGACNTLRGDHDMDVHRSDMQVLVRAGLHPTNRPKQKIADLRRYYKSGLKALRKLRAGKPIEEPI